MRRLRHKTRDIRVEVTIFFLFLLLSNSFTLEANAWGGEREGSVVIEERIVVVVGENAPQGYWDHAEKIASKIEEVYGIKPIIEKDSRFYPSSNEWFGWLIDLIWPPLKPNEYNLICVGEPETNRLVRKYNDIFPINFEEENGIYFLVDQEAGEYYDDRYGVVVKVNHASEKFLILIGGLGEEGRKSAVEHFTNYYEEILKTEYHGNVISKSYVEITNVELIPEGWKVTLRVDNPYYAEIGYEVPIVARSERCSFSGGESGLLKPKESKEVSIILKPIDPMGDDFSCYVKLEANGNIHGRVESLGMIEFSVGDNPDVWEQFQKGTIYGFEACKEQYADWGCYAGAIVTRIAAPMAVCLIPSGIGQIACLSYLAVLTGEECYYAVAKGGVSRWVGCGLGLVAVSLQTKKIISALQAAQAVGGSKGATEIAEALKMVGERGGDKAEAGKLFEKLLKKEFYSEAEDDFFRFTSDRIRHVVESGYPKGLPAGHFDEIVTYFKLKNNDELINLIEEAIRYASYSREGDIAGYKMYEFVKEGKTLWIVLDMITKTIRTIFPG